MNFSIQSIYNWYRNAIRNPKYRLWIILGSLVYLLSPIDISPDFLPIVGWIDDGIIATLLVSEVSQLLLERLKPSKSETAAANSSAPTEASTVDVNAVSAE
jgi:uncharacterized membrane protein YkvA (DUF1232 family)